MNSIPSIIPPFINNSNSLNNSHQLIKNQDEYITYKKYISIHSEDRDYIKYPNSNYFEIELPEDYLNVAALRLVQWSFPSNYNTFSSLNGNITMTFQINNPYNPSEHGITDPLLETIYKILFNSYNVDYLIVIEEGFYNPQQMANELRNKFNNAVTLRINQYLIDNSLNDLYMEFQESGGYNNFIIVYNNVGQKLWFGNKSDDFILTNTLSVVNTVLNNDLCLTDSNGIQISKVADFSDWGLPANLGLKRLNTQAINGVTIQNINEVTNLNGVIVPRFYYGDVFPGDNGFWLTPDVNRPGSKVYWIESPYKLNLMGPAFFYLELDGNNCIDETQPFSVSNFTLTNNITQGIVNSSFAKLSIPTTPLSQWFDRDQIPYKYYYPPAERIRKLKFKLRYHNGQLVNMGVFNYSLLLEFTLIVPQILRDSKIKSYNPANIN